MEKQQRQAIIAESTRSTKHERGYYPQEIEQNEETRQAVDATPGRAWYRPWRRGGEVVSLTPSNPEVEILLPPLFEFSTAAPRLAVSAHGRRMTRDLWHGVRGGTCLVAVWGWRRGICRWNGHGMRVVMMMMRPSGDRGARRGQAYRKQE